MVEQTQSKWAVPREAIASPLARLELDKYLPSRDDIPEEFQNFQNPWVLKVHKTHVNRPIVTPTRGNPLLYSTKTYCGRSWVWMFDAPSRATCKICWTLWALDIPGVNEETIRLMRETRDEERKKALAELGIEE